jgi:hypothetical protein
MESWLKAIDLTKVVSIKIPETRKLVRAQYKKALKSVDNKQHLSQDWLSWEKLFGTAQTLEVCMKLQPLEEPKPLKQVEASTKRPKRPA